MNSTLLRFLAMILAIGAIATAWIGYRISTRPPADAVKVVTPSYPQVIAAHDIPPGKLLTADDVELVTTAEPHPQAYRSVQDVLGKLTQAPLITGEAILPRHLPALGVLAEALGPDERAVAVKVNEVIGVGGFIKPGDRVDVLLFLRAERETDNVSSAQVVLKDIKVLAYGDTIAENDNADQQPQTNGTTDSLTGKAGGRKSEAKKEKESRSAILAVPEHQVSRLMLAESSGVLRLALRGMQPPEAQADPANQFIRLEDVAKPVVSQPAVTADGAAPTQPSPGKRTASSTKRERIILHKGEHVDVVTVSR
ncbi:MAG TPA: Flp pilus assembly protein CpaB [Methylophilaceae bacterium]|jgi:pilus assembly protein CpaB